MGGMSESKTQRERLWSPLFVLIVGVSLCTFLVGQGLNSGTTVYLSLYGGTATWAGVLAAVFSAAAGCTRLLCGPFIDRTGRRAVMVAGAVALVVGTLGPVATHASAAFTAFRLLQGMGFGAVSAAAATAAADVLPASRLGEGIGYFGLGQALAMSMGPAFALYLVSTDPAENLYLGLGAVAVLGCVCTLLCRYERRPETLPETSAYRRMHARPDGGKTARADEDAEGAGSACADAPDAASGAGVPRGVWRFVERRALPGMVPMLLMTPSFGFSIFFMGLYGTSLGLSNTGLYYTVCACAMIVVRLVSSSLLDSMAPAKLFAVAAAFGAGGFAMLLAAGTLCAGGAAGAVLFVAAGAPIGVCMGITTPLGQAVSVRNTPPERWGAATSLYQIAPDIGNSAGGIVWGLMNDAFGFPATICAVMVCIAASALLAGALYPKEPPR